MAGARGKFDQDFREGVVRLVREAGRPVGQVARDLGINEGALGSWGCAANARRLPGVARWSIRGAMRKMGNCWLPGVALRWGRQAASCCVG